MADKDITEHSFIAIKPIFANIVNTVFFDSQQVVDPSDLEDADPNGPYLDEKKKRHKTIGDVHMYWKQHQSTTIITRFGGENETNHTREIALKVAGYLGVNYALQLTTGRKQLLPNEKVTPTDISSDSADEALKEDETKTRNKVYYYPVFVAVLNYDDTKWDEIVLADCLDYPEGEEGKLIKKAAEKYGIRIPVLNLAFIPPEEAKARGFHPDLCHLTEILWCIREKIPLKNREEKIRYVDEFRDLVKALFLFTDEQVLELIPDDEDNEGGVSLGSVWDKYMDIYVEEGKKDGKKEGEKKGENKVIVRMVETYAHKYQVSIENACNVLSVTYEEYLTAKDELLAQESRKNIA